MKQNINIEAEGNELVLKNKAGDYVIIPKKYRTEVQDMIKDGCHSCIDTLVETLPVMEDYAGDGSLLPDWDKVKVNHNNQIKEYDISSPEYKDLYNSGKLMSYDKNRDIYIAPPLKEATVAAEAPQWLKYKREYEKNNPKSDYINQYLDPFARSLGNTETNYPKRLDNEYEEKSLDYVSEQLIKNKPQGKHSRAEWLNQMSDKEEELIKRNPKYQSSLWADTKRGLTSLVEQNPLQIFQNILNSSDYTNREKQEMLKDYVDHPVMSKLGDTTKILNPLTIPSKMVQSTYKDDYSFTDALKGKKNNAGIVEDIVTDPLNLVGVDLAGKLSKVDKAIDATKVGSKVLNKTDDVLSKIGIPLNRPIDIHDIRKKYYNDLILQPDEIKLLQKEGKGNRVNYRNVSGTDIVGKIHEDNIKLKETDFDKKSIEEALFGKDYSAEKVANKKEINNIENGNFNISNKSVFEENKLNIKSYKDEIEDLIKDFKTDISVFERTETSMKADKWLEEWFTHPETKKAFINYGGTEKEWADILNTLENPIRSSVKYGKGQPGGVYMDVFKQASIPVNAKVDVGVHEGIHKTGLLTKKSNPILNDLWNDFTDVIREIPTESYPEIFRLRYNMGLKPGQKIDMETLEKGFETIKDGYRIPSKIKDKNKLLEIINKAPALIPFLGVYLQSQNQNKKEQ